MTPSSPRRRILLVAAAIFFVTGVYLCVTRLSAISFNIETLTNLHKSILGSASGDKSSEEATEPKKPRLKLNHADLPMEYGHFDRPGFDGLKLIQALPEEHVPTAENGRRLIIIGDIHGMDEQLEALLEKTSYDDSSDHIISVGDMVSKGPHSRAVVSRLMRLNASAVRGNHEDRVLLAHETHKSEFGVMVDLDDVHAEKRKDKYKDLAVAKKLSEKQLAWLADLPVILTIDPLSIYVVHAGLVPGVKIAKQDPWAAMNMRTLSYPREKLRKQADEEPRILARDEESDDVPYEFSQGRVGDAKKDDGAQKDENEEEDGNEEEYDDYEDDEVEDTEEDEDVIDTSDIPFDRQVAVPTDRHKGENWTKGWNKAQKRLHKKERRTVIYGHDAKRGYRKTKYTFGIDSACVKGEALTALVVEAKKGGGFRYTTVQVRCE